MAGKTETLSAKPISTFTADWAKKENSTQERLEWREIMKLIK